MSRYLVSFRLFLLTALLVTGAASALPALASISVSAITASPNVFPSTGGPVVVFLTCANAAGTPTGSATLTDSHGTLLSQNACFFYQYDANGNPVLYTYLIVQANNSTTAPASYTVNATVTDQSGVPSTLSQNFQQAFGNPILINSLTATPNPLPSTATSLLVTVNLTDNGPNQKGFYKGEAMVTNSAGTVLDIEPLWTLPRDSSGNGNYDTTLNNIPVNTTAAPNAYGVSITVEDNAGVTVTSSMQVSQLPSPAASPVTQIRFAPRFGYAIRMVGGVFQGSNDGVNYTTLATITTAPLQFGWTTLPISTTTVYRYLRYLAPNGSYGNIAELEFDSGTGSSLAKITGTPFGSPGSFRCARCTFSNVFDGSTATYFNGLSPNGDFVGLDIGSGAM